MYQFSQHDNIDCKLKLLVSQKRLKGFKIGERVWLLKYHQCPIPDFIKNLDNFAKCHFYFIGCNLKGGPSNENFQAQQCAIMPDPGLKIGFQETTLENWQETATTVYHFSLFKIGSLCIVNHEQYSTYIYIMQRSKAMHCKYL